MCRTTKLQPLLKTIVMAVGMLQQFESYQVMPVVVKPGLAVFGINAECNSVARGISCVFGSGVI